MSTDNVDSKNDDSVKLLEECNAGSKMAVESFNEVLDKIKDDSLKQLLLESQKEHKELGNEIHAMLIEYGSEDKEPNPIAKSMSWMKTNVKLTMHESDSTVADLMTDGCNMGIKSLFRYLNQYKKADLRVQQVCGTLIDIEDKLRKGLRQYL